ncbi:hypothetical protein JXQ70_10040, partial [bacterium]|nr:hypothetical protein [bacterium]
YWREDFQPLEQLYQDFRQIRSAPGILKKCPPRKGTVLPDRALFFVVWQAWHVVPCLPYAGIGLVNRGTKVKREMT